MYNNLLKMKTKMPEISDQKIGVVKKKPLVEKTKQKAFIAFVKQII